MSANGQRNYICFQTVGCLHNRYRLVHSWVSAMMLNVQSEDSIFYSLFYLNLHTQGYNRLDYLHTQGYNRELLERLLKVGD
jgi:hypothetical protein